MVPYEKKEAEKNQDKNIGAHGCRQPLVSIIVPVYNVEEYLEQCIQSLLGQTYKNIEIILVDDGSADSSGGICDRQGRTDSRITVIHKENGGLSDARNAGIDRANGEWLMFVDSDDWVHENYCRDALDIVRESDADIGVFHYWEYWEGEGIRTVREGPEGIFNSEEALCHLASGNTRDYAWNKIYKRELFSGIRYPVGRVFEDIGTTYKLFDAAQRIRMVKTSLYFYRRRKGSITLSPRAGAVMDMFELLMEQYKFCSKKYPAAKEQVRDNVLRRALECSIKNHGTITAMPQYPAIRKVLRSGRHIPKNMPFSYKLMLVVYRISEPFFYRLCVLAYKIKARKQK